MMQFGVSYFGVRNPEHMQRDLDDMVRLGFDYVILTFSENDHRFYQGSLAACVEQAHARGLTVWVDPWGVGGVFAGEAFSNLGAWEVDAQQQRSDGRPVPLLCLTSDILRDYLQRWIQTAAEVLQADAIFWDEPHFYIPFGESRDRGLWSCRCARCQDGFSARYGKPLPDRETVDVHHWKQDTIATLIDDVTAMAAAHGLANIVCVLPDHDRLDELQAKFDRFAANPHLQTLSTDPYPLWHQQPIDTTRQFCEALQKSCQRYGKAAQMWIQGFRVSAGQEPLLGEEMQLMADCDIQDIAIWSYLATAYMSSHACADSDRVWRVFTDTMQALRRTHPTS
jgi:hypothetical protein